MTVPDSGPGPDPGPDARRANIAGLGLIGGSIGLALTERGWMVTGDDLDPLRAQRAQAMGVISHIGLDPGAHITFVATPVLAVADQVRRALAETTGVVTDVGSVKAGIANAIHDPRFVGGHPMAGSELDGLDGADGTMFEGAVWVLTPTETTVDATFASVASVVAEFGAEVIALPPERHDQVVAVISHVPHLAAATLMGVASQRGEEHAALLRLAAGGFRDMTRIVSGHPAIWLDICAENRPAILSALDDLITGLGEMRDVVSNDDRAGLHRRLQSAREARANLPSRVNQPSELAEMRIPIPDRTGAAAGLFTLAAELGVNIASFEVVHSLEGTRGVATLLVDASTAELYRGGLIARGVPSRRSASRMNASLPTNVYTVEPVVESLSAVVDVPGSKSVANRALICAALADGESQLDGIAPGDDTAAMLDGLQLLGIGVGSTGRHDSVAVRGVGSPAALRPGPITLPTRLAGTTSRFLTSLAAAGPGPYTIDGLAPLRERPMTPLHDALVALGATVEPGERWGHLPVTVSGPLGGSGAGDRVSIRGDVSSQYITALMLVAPTLPDGLLIQLTTPLVSRSYVGITAAVMAAFGVDGVEIGDDTVSVPTGTYRAVRYRVEPDASSASYPLAAAAIVGGTVHVPGLTAGSLQGDARFAAVLGEMGCDVIVGERGTTVTRDGHLRGIDIDMVDLSDLVPTLAVVAPFAHTPTTIRGVGFIRSKESDRLGDLCTELRRAGIDASETDDGLVVRPGPPTAACFQTHHDHRLAMALALLGLVAPGVEIDDPAVVSKSWPGYWRMLEDLQ